MSENANTKPKQNVLFIIVDDLRAEIGAFIDSVNRPWLNDDIKTPHIDALASRSVVFKQAYVQQALCNPSRTSFLTGRRPETTGIRDNHSWFTETGNPNIVTLPGYFYKNGYTTISLGKVFHHSKNIDEKLPHTWTYNAFPMNNYKCHEPYMEVKEAEAKSEPLQEQLLLKQTIKLLNNASAAYFKYDKPFLKV